MTPNETEAQIDAENKANVNKNVQPETDSKSLSNNQEHNDHPSNVLDFPIKNDDADIIGMDDMLEGMVVYINHAQMPFTIAVQGEWGIGKTSFLNLLKDRLLKEKASLYYSVWVDACDFTLLQSPESAVINMLQSMIYQIGNLNPTIAGSQEGKKKLKTIILFIKKFGKIIVKKTIQAATGDDVSGEMAEEFYDNLVEDCSNNEEKQDNNQDSTFLTVQSLRNKVIELIDYVLDPNNNPNYLITESCLQQNYMHHTISIVDQNKKKQDNNNSTANNTNQDQENRKLVFFIDNLDRIDPTLAVEILEITKNIFDFDKSIFIVALDNNIALRGLQKKLGTLAPENERTFRAYFDKFVQQSISLPNQITTVSILLFELLVYVNYFTEQELELSPKNTDTIRTKNANFIQANTLKEALSNFASDSFDKNNPRFIKRFVNTLSLLLHIKQETSSSVDTITKALMFIIMIIQYSFFDIYKTMSSRPFISKLHPKYLPERSVLDELERTLHETIDPYNTLKPSVGINSYYTHIDSVIFILKSIENIERQSIRDFNKKLGDAIKIMAFCEQDPIFKVFKNRN